MEKSAVLPYGTLEWEWDPSHFPLPLSPSFASVYPRWMERAFRRGCAEFGVLADGVEVRTRRGYLYSRVKPVGLDRSPPAWLARLGLRLWWAHPALRRRVQTAVRAVQGDHATALLRRWETEWRPALLERQAALRALDLAPLADDELADHLLALLRDVDGWVTIHFVLHAAIAIPLQQLAELIAATPALAAVSVAELVQGVSRASSEPARALAQVAATVRDQPNLRERAGLLPPDAALALLRDESPAFAGELGRYLDRYGDALLGRYEFIVPAVAEQPAALLPALLHAASDPDAEGRALAAADALGKRHLEEAAARLGDAAAERRFRSAVYAARRAYAVRDDNVRLTFSVAFGFVRRALQESGRRLAQRGIIADADDIFFLRVQETLAALRGRSTPPAALIERRRRAWQQAAAEPPPPAFGRPTPRLTLDGLPDEARLTTTSLVRYMREIMAAPDVYALPAGSETEREQPAVLRGVGAVAGVYTGVARVLSGSGDFERLAAGEVLVCAMSSPEWSAVLSLAGALVTDHGGILSHAAVIAREFGIPAVVATRRATGAIPDGARVRVDGSTGEVRILDG